MSGYLLIQARSREEAAELAETVVGIAGVAGAQLVNGPYDVIAEVHAAQDASVESAVRALGGVLRVIPLAIGSRAA